MTDHILDALYLALSLYVVSTALLWVTT